MALQTLLDKIIDIFCFCYRSRWGAFFMSTVSFSKLRKGD